MKKTISLLFFSLIALITFSQTYLLNSSTTAISTCSGTLYDDGGASGDYLTNQHNILTITPSTPGTSAMLVFTSWSIGPNDSLLIYNGPTTASPLLGFPYYSVISPVGVQIMASAANPTGQLTLEWFSYSSSPGFAATIGCHTPCQQILITIDSNNCIPNMSNGYIDVCFGDAVTFSAFGTYPENNAVYTQSDSLSLFIWTFGDGVIDTGQTVTHTYSSVSGYDFYLMVEDTLGCGNINSAAGRVRYSGNPIVDVKPLPDACANDVIELSIGISSTSTIQINQTQGGASGTLSVADTTYLPDGSGTSYTSSVTYTEFLPGATLMNASDFLGVCASIFHSYSGDLDITLQCPNGTQVALKSYPDGGSVEFGEPPVPAASGSTTPCYGQMGVPYEYCWNTTPIYGTMAAEEIGAPSHTFTNVCGNSVTANYYPAGSYAPENPFSALVGCPLNGTWSLLITDHMLLDEGYITEWHISLNPALIPGGWSYVVPIDSIVWAGPSLTVTSDSTAEIISDTGGTFQYTMTIYDAFGCTYDTTFPVVITPNPNPTLGADTAICEGSVLTLNAGAGDQYFWSTGAVTQSITPDATGIYAVTVTNSTGTIACYGSDTIEVAIVPWPSVNLGPDLCENSSVTLDAQNPGFNYEWSNGATTQTTTASSSGTYSVTVSYSTYNICTDVDSVYIHVIPTPEVDLGPDFEMCKHEYRDFSVSQSSPEYTYLWSTGSTSPHITAQNLQVGSTTYSVTVTGCESVSDSVTINVLACDLTIPNVITPKGDGLNDVFKVTNLEYYPNSILMVFNRWGKKIFESNNYLNDWDGEDFADGTYYIILKVNYGDEDYEEYHGTLTIMRE